jgi:hypothetical protein
VKKLLVLFYLVPFFGTSQIKHLDPVQSKTVGTAWYCLEKIAWLQEELADGQTFYQLVYKNYFDSKMCGANEIKFTGGQAVLDELCKSLQDAIAKPKCGKTSILLGDQLLSMEVKKGLTRKFLEISADAAVFQLNENQIEKLFGK